MKNKELNTIKKKDDVLIFAQEVSSTFGVE